MESVAAAQTPRRGTSGVAVSQYGGSTQVSFFFSSRRRAWFWGVHRSHMQFTCNIHDKKMESHDSEAEETLRLTSNKLFCFCGACLSHLYNRAPSGASGRVSTSWSSQLWPIKEPFLPAGRKPTPLRSC